MLAIGSWLTERPVKHDRDYLGVRRQGGARGQFELAYGPGGAWSKLFARCPGLRGTTLLRDTQDPQRYLMIDVWNTLDQREQALAEHQAEYADLETALAGWTESRNELGVFRVRAEATVRPQGRSRRNTVGRAR